MILTAVRLCRRRSPPGTRMGSVGARRTRRIHLSRSHRDSAWSPPSSRPRHRRGWPQIFGRDVSLVSTSGMRGVQHWAPNHHVHVTIRQTPSPSRCRPESWSHRRREFEQAPGFSCAPHGWAAAPCEVTRRKGREGRATKYFVIRCETCQIVGDPAGTWFSIAPHGDQRAVCSSMAEPRHVTSTSPSNGGS